MSAPTPLCESLTMPHSSYTLEIGERMTRAKAEVFLARFGPDVEAAALATVAQLQRDRPTTEEVAWRVYSVEQLTGHMRDPEHTGIGAGHVSWLDPGVGRHRVTGIHVLWETDEIDVR